MEKIRERSMVKFILLSLITCGIYRMYFFYRISMDINAICQGDGRESESSLMAAILGQMTFGLYEIFWLCKLGQRLRVNTPRYGFKMFETGKDIAILNAFSFGFIGSWELIKNVNKVARVYNQYGLADVRVGGGL